MPGTVKSELLSDADRSHKYDSQEKVCWIRHLSLDKSHFITGERQRAETVENLHKIFFDKISQKKYNEIGLYEICKKTGYIWIIIVILYILFARSR